MEVRNRKTDETKKILSDLIPGKDEKKVRMRIAFHFAVSQSFFNLAQKKFLSEKFVCKQKLWHDDEIS